MPQILYLFESYKIPKLTPVCGPRVTAKARFLPGLAPRNYMPAYASLFEVDWNPVIEFSTKSEFDKKEVKLFTRPIE